MSVIATHWRLKRRGSYFDIISFFSSFIVKRGDGASSLQLYGFDPGRSRPLKLGIRWICADRDIRKNRIVRLEIDDLNLARQNWRRPDAVVNKINSRVF